MPADVEDRVCIAVGGIRIGAWRAGWGFVDDDAFPVTANIAEGVSGVGAASQEDSGSGYSEEGGFRIHGIMYLGYDGFVDIRHKSIKINSLSLK